MGTILTMEKIKFLLQLNDWFSCTNSMMMNRLHELHKNVRVLQVMHQNIMVWQVSIFDQLQRFDL